VEGEMKRWLIREWDGNEIRAEHVLPGNLSPKEIETILQRCVCRDLSVPEILAASRRRSDPRRAGLLDRVAAGRLLDYGHGDIHYSAEWQEVALRPEV
jgi:hypothetical protein